MSKMSRRDLLKGGAAVAAGASLMSFGSMFGYQRVFA
jgi:hypothetical protein